MEFPGIGTLSYDPPDEDLRPWFKKKHEVCVGGLEFNKNGKIYGSDVYAEVQQIVARLPEDQREKAMKDRLDLWEFCVMCSKPGESIEVSKVVENWVDRAYAPAAERKISMEKDKEVGQIFFGQMDLNKDGVIDFSEWQKGNSVFGEESIKLVFDTIDADKNGVISMEEWCYALVCYDFVSGSENLISQMFGKVSVE